MTLAISERASGITEDCSANNNNALVLVVIAMAVIIVVLSAILIRVWLYHHRHLRSHQFSRILLGEIGVIPMLTQVEVARVGVETNSKVDVRTRAGVGGTPAEVIGMEMELKPAAKVEQGVEASMCMGATVVAKAMEPAAAPSRETEPEPRSDSSHSAGMDTRLGASCTNDPPMSVAPTPMVSSPSMPDSVSMAETGNCEGGGSESNGHLGDADGRADARMQEAFDTAMSFGLSNAELEALTRQLASAQEHGGTMRGSAWADTQVHTAFNAVMSFDLSGVALEMLTRRLASALGAAMVAAAFKRPSARR